jgi:uncharacterized membrane protein YjgN (DUF898 family)
MDIDTAAATAPERHPVRFTASGSEYFRIWIVNLLLTVVTLGLYLPWAKVRKLKYFYANTWVGGDALDFHGEPARMLRGTLIAGAFLIAYLVAGAFSGWAELLAAVAFVGLWPALFHASLRFRLANTSWRGLRFHFAGDRAGAYGAMLPPLMLAILPLALAGLTVDPGSREPSPLASGLIGFGMLAFAASFPFFLWKLRRYQHDHFTLGGLQTRLTARAGSVYGVFLRMLGLGLLALIGMALVFGLFASPGLIGRKAGASAAILTLLGLFAIGGVLLFNILPQSYLQVRLQNLFWSATGNPVLRFDSQMKLGPYIGLQLKNFLLIFLTLGLYWPFAVVHTRRARLEAVTLETRGSLDALTRTGGQENPAAVGDMAADLFGMDIGL